MSLDAFRRMSHFEKEKCLIFCSSEKNQIFEICIKQMFYSNVHFSIDQKNGTFTRTFTKKKKVYKITVKHKVNTIYFYCLYYSISTILTKYNPFPLTFDGDLIHFIDHNFHRFMKLFKPVREAVQSGIV